MTLRYDDGFAPDSVVVLRRQSHRVELHIKRMDSLWLLVGLSGDEAQRADNIKSQGPFTSRELVESMANAIGAALGDKGYGRFDGTAAIWSPQAAAESKTVRQRRALHDFERRFDPDTDLH